MNHNEAETQGVVERYLLGELTEPEETAFEQHYFECPECAEEIRVSEVFLANLRANLAAQKAPATVVAISSARRRFGWARTAGLAAAVVLAAVLGYQNVIEIPHLRHDLESASAVDSPPTFYLAETRSAEDVLTIPKDSSHVSLLLNQKPGRIYPYYDCVLSQENGVVQRSFRVTPPSGREEWQLRLPTAGLAAQAYVLKIRGAESSGGAGLQDVAEYHFRLEYR